MYPLLLLVFGALGFLLLRAFRLMAPERSGRTLRGFFGEEAAATTMEFTLVFPIFMIIVLIMLQLLLLFNAAQVVSYAAFSAARSAIVVIPMQQGSEGPNQLSAEETSDSKRTIIRQAAAAACISISPAYTDWLKSAGVFGVVGSFSGSLYGIGEGFVWAGLAQSVGLPNPARLAQKAMYSGEFTTVELRGDTQGRFSENAPVTVTVRHKFFLNVPFVGVIFSDDNFLARAKDPLTRRIILGEGQYRRSYGWGRPQKTITSSYALLNEGGREAL